MAMETDTDAYSKHEFEVRLTGPRINVSLSIPVMFMDKPVLVEATHGNVIDVSQNTADTGSLLDRKTTPKSTTSTGRSYGARNGGGRKPASDSQKHFLKQLGDEKNVDVDALVNKKFNKTIDALVGEEANMLIQDLKGNRI